MSGLFEMVPNISEGRDAGTIDACVRAVEACGAKVLHRTSDPVHNRSVLTIAGGYDELCDAAVELAGVARERIDLRTHRGIHPRIGALDVLPFIPLRDADMAAAVSLARQCAARIWEQHGIPSFLYGEAAATPLRRNLATVRSGQFEGLDVRFEHPDWRPDFGEPRSHASAGAIAIGAREILIAFNVELRTSDLAVAKRIARAVRASAGGLKTLKALGLQISDSVVQVSLNLTNYAATPLYRVVEMIRTLAAQDGVEILKSELIGCMPHAALRETCDYYLGITEERGLDG